MAMLMHASSNAVSDEFISPMFTGNDADTLGWIRVGLWVLAAVTVILVAGRNLRSDPKGSSSRCDQDASRDESCRPAE
jgi:hypothetical protein